jgi:hypothetical protein
LGISPGLLEGVEVGGDHVAAFDASELKDRSLSGWDPVSVLADEELTVRVVDRAVRHAPVSPDLYLTLLI